MIDNENNQLVYELIVFHYLLQESNYNLRRFIMTEIVTFIKEVAYVTWPAFIMAFWLTLALAIVCACIQTIRNGYRAIKARFRKEPKYHMRNLRRL